MHNDLTFFTNEAHATLLDRFKATLKDVQFFDVLVGYFRTSGFKMLADSFADIEHIRILVGLSVDRTAFDLIEQNPAQTQIAMLATKTTHKKVEEDLVEELERAPDTAETEQSIRAFMELLRSGRLEIKAHRSQNLHAKVYISRFHPDDRDFGRVITGSSNFSYPGLVGQYEFNVELKDPADVRFALAQFEALWAEAVDISDTYVQTITKKTWLNDSLSPYHIYLKFLYEYFKEDINLDDDLDSYVPDGFLTLKYQQQAVLSAKKILESYNGVFLSDVVGLGKTYISALLAQQLPGRKLVICPPVLQDYWRETFNDFHVAGVTVESMGKLDHILASKHEKFAYVFVDEAHRFRNEGTASYEKLHAICWGKKVILVSATPLNNTITDIHAQLKLFQAPKKSTIPGVSNLDAFFDQMNREITQEAKYSPDYVEAVKRMSKQVRERVLKYVMVRRTRNEIMSYFADDVHQQGLLFPQIAAPQRIVYTFDAATDRVFSETIERLKAFRYARYMPLLYLRRQLSAFEQQAQRNVGGFMKGVLVKRLESSFHAFKQTLQRFILSYERFVQMLDHGTIYISKSVDVFDLLERDAMDVLLQLVEDERAAQYAADDFAPTFRSDLIADLHLLRDVQALWQDIDHDPKLTQFVHDLHTHPLLQGQKILIFSESSETVEYLYDHLEQVFPQQVIAFSSHRGMYQGSSISTPLARNLINEQFDPRHHVQRDTVRILITTDVLAEGVNLHRSNVVINYDLPWNPTRVLQRVGRVNRVGTQHEYVYIFNFFPTAQSSEHLSLEDNIKAKLQAFHDMLGEDTRYLSDDEAITQHELFGDRLYHHLTTSATYEGEDEERSELAYLQEIRRIRDEQTALFEKIKRLPKKARTGRSLRPGETLLQSGAHVLTFFRKGMLKKFFLATEGGVQELTFLDAVDLLEVDDHGEQANAAQRISIPESFYELLCANKQAFAIRVAGDGGVARVPRRGGRSNESTVLAVLKQVARDQRLTEDDESYLQAVIRAFEHGIVPSKTIKSLKDSIDKARTIDAIRILALIRTHVASTLVTMEPSQRTPDDPQEVILSAYLLQK